MSTQFSFIWPLDWILPGATTLGQNGRGNDANEGAFRIPWSFSNTFSTLPLGAHKSFGSRRVEEMVMEFLVPLLPSPLWKFQSCHSYSIFIKTIVE